MTTRPTGSGLGSLLVPHLTGRRGALAGSCALTVAGVVVDLARPWAVALRPQAHTVAGVHAGNGERRALRGLDLTVCAGETVALVGPSGAGKSTALGLLLRLRHVDAGRVLIDGVDVRDVRLASLRQHVALVPQDAWLFDGTLLDNVCFGSARPCRADAVSAGRLAALDDVVAAPPQGWDTPLGAAGDRARLTLDREASCARTPHAGLARLLADGRAHAVPHLLFAHLGGPALDARRHRRRRRAAGRPRGDGAGRRPSQRAGRRPRGRSGPTATSSPPTSCCATGCRCSSTSAPPGASAARNPPAAEARTGRSPRPGRWGPAAFPRWPRRSRLRAVVEQMLCPDPALRPTLTGSLRLVAGLLSTDQAPWPAAVHRSLTEPPDGVTDRAGGRRDARRDAWS